MNLTSGAKRCAVASLVLPAFLAACDVTEDRSNRRPRILLTAGPMEGDSTSWFAHFAWHGSDADGFVDHFEYVLDLPSERLGAIDDPRTTGIDWQDTTGVEATFGFTTPMPGPAGTKQEPRGRYSGRHSFAIRTVDDEGARSTAAFVTFTALNFTPRTQFDEGEGYPVDHYSFVAGCPGLVVWSATDPDHYGEEAITAFDFKFGDLPGFPEDYADRSGPELHDLLAGVPWQRLPGYEQGMNLELGGRVGAAVVRGIDLSGAVEDVFVRGQNVVLIDAMAPAATPRVRLSEPTLGNFDFPGPPGSAVVTAGVVLQFVASGSASAYGGPFYEYNWGFDVDPDSADDDSGHGWSNRWDGWSGWTYDPRLGPIYIDEPGAHRLVLKIRNQADCEPNRQTTGILDLTVVTAAP